MSSTLFLNMLTVSLPIALLILLLLILSKQFGKRLTAKCRYIIWAAVILRLCIPFGAVMLPSMYEVDIPEKVEFTAPKSDTTDIPVATVTDAVQTVPPVSQSIPVIDHSAVSVPDKTIEVPDNTTAVEQPKPLVADTAIIIQMLSYVWLAGAVIFLTWKLTAYNISAAAVIRSSKAAGETDITLYKKLCGRYKIKRAPILLVSGKAASPMLCGYFKPRIILPDIELSQNSLAEILAHELTHYRRRDLWMKLLCVLAESLHWFNPLAHIASKRCNAEMELSCDEAVLAGLDEATRRSYGNVMLDIIKRCGKTKGTLTTQFNPRKNAVKERFYGIMDMTKKKRGLWIIVAVVLICVVAGTVIGCSIGGKTLPEGHYYREGLYLKCDNGSDMILIEDYNGDGSLAPCSMTAYNDGVSFADLTDGDRIKIEVMLIGETYPMQTQVYSVEKLSDGERSDIDAELLAQLAEMGWIEKAELIAIYRCDDVYRDENTKTYGSAAVVIPVSSTDYSVRDCQILLCDDGCDPTDVVSRAFWGYAPAYRIDKYTEFTAADGRSFTTRKYHNTVPDEIAAEMRKQGAPENVIVPREYLYLLTLDDTHYAFIVIEPENKDGEKPEGEEAAVNEIVKAVKIELSADESDEQATAITEEISSLLSMTVAEIRSKYGELTVEYSEDGPGYPVYSLEKLPGVTIAFIWSMDEPLTDSMLPNEVIITDAYGKDISGVSAGDNIENAPKTWTADSYSMMNGTVTMYADSGNCRISLVLSPGESGWNMEMQEDNAAFDDYIKTWLSDFSKSPTGKIAQIRIKKHTVAEATQTITSIDDWNQLGLTREDYRYPFFKAFLERDTVTLEKLSNCLAGLYDSYKQLEFGDYQINRIKQTPQSEYAYTLAIEIIKGTDALPAGNYQFVYNEYPGNCLSRIFPVNNNSSEAYVVLKNLLNTTRDYALDGGNSDSFNWGLTEYIIGRLSKTQISEKNISDYAEKHLGIDAFKPYEGCLGDDGYYIPAHGGGQISCEPVSAEYDEASGEYTVTVQFFADYGMTVYSHRVAYRMKYDGTDWAFLEYEVQSKGEFEPYKYAT